MSVESTHWFGCDSVHPNCSHPAEEMLGSLVTVLRRIHQPTGLRGDRQWCMNDEQAWPCVTEQAIRDCERGVGDE